MANAQKQMTDVEKLINLLEELQKDGTFDKLFEGIEPNMEELDMQTYRIIGGHSEYDYNSLQKFCLQQMVIFIERARELLALAKGYKEYPTRTYLFYKSLARSPETCKLLEQNNPDLLGYIKDYEIGHKYED